MKEKEILKNNDSLGYQIDKDNIAQMQAYQLVSKTNESFFLTGKAGTGKTTFLHYIQKHVKKNFVVVAPTGVAAIVAGGMTIHSFFGMPFTPITLDTVFTINASKWSTLTHVDTIIIDEISMVRCDLIDGIDRVLQMAMNNNLPFGGKQIIFSGDLYQLEPVLDHGDSDLVDFYATEYQCSAPYFYYAHVFKRIQLPRIEFTKIYRQSDPEFQLTLDHIRQGKLVPEEIAKINQIGLDNNEHLTNECLILTSRNDTAERINSERMNSIESEEYIYQGETEGEFNKTSYPAPLSLKLKKGARVMLTQNDTQHRWVNGSVGTVTDLNESRVIVQLDHGGEHEIPKAEWENIRYSYNHVTRKLDKKTIGTFTQIPLKQAWAITIHKSQGMTFDDLKIDLNMGVFMPGQLYVALSRVCSLQGLRLTSPIRHHYIMGKYLIDNFLKEYSSMELIDKNLSDYADYYKALQLNDYDKAVSECDQLMTRELLLRKDINSLPIAERKKAEKQNNKHEEDAYFAAERLITIIRDMNSLSASSEPIDYSKGAADQDLLLNAVVACKNKDYQRIAWYAEQLMLSNSCLANYHFLKCIAQYLQKNYTEAGILLDSWQENVECLDARYFYLRAMVAYHTNQPFVSHMSVAIDRSPRYYPYIEQLQQMMSERGLVLKIDESEGAPLVNIFNTHKSDIAKACAAASEKQYASFVQTLLNFQE